VCGRRVLPAQMVPRQVQILLSLLDFDTGLQEDGDAPRVHHIGTSEPTGEPADAKGGQVQIESGFASETIRELLYRGHRIIAATSGDFGGYQAIWYDAEKDVYYYGATESRKDGVALGY
jgi:gamma-glutamyltranspeptidase / glutathione hydrolase